MQKKPIIGELKSQVLKNQVWKSYAGGSEIFCASDSNKIFHRYVSVKVDRLIL